MNRPPVFLRAVGPLVLVLMLAAMFRLGLYVLHRGDFAHLSLWQVLEAFVVGLRFDLSLAMLLVALPLLLAYVPARWAAHRVWRGLWLVAAYLGVVAMAFLTAIDLAYFGTVHRHMGSEVLALGRGDWGAMVSLALRDYAAALLAFALGALALAWVWRWLVAPPVVRPRWFWSWVYLPLGLLALLVVARGGVSGKPLSVGEAFFSNDLAQGYLALNGAFAVSRALLESPPARKTFMPEEQAVREVQAWLGGRGFADPNYPLLREQRSRGGGPLPNVMVLMLESWGAQHIDALRTLQGLPALGATPHFDALARQGRLYRRFYANGQRSILGAAALLASQPTFEGMPFLGEGLEQNRLSFLGQIAQTQGYSTFFVQSSERASLRFDAIAARAGFATYQGAEDLPNLHPNPKPPYNWGTWDHNTLQGAHTLAMASPQPFLGFVFTSGTHTPWMIPEQRFAKWAGGTPRESFLNSLWYADWALGELVAAARRGGYFDNTVFVLVADHADEFVDQPQDVRSLFQVPLLLVGPGIEPGVDDRVGSQFDLLPTLMDVAGWSGPYAGWGRSLLESPGRDDRAALGVRGTVLDWITAEGWVSHDLQRRVGQSPGLSPEQAERLERRLLATYQLGASLQAGNRVMPQGPAR